MSVKKNLYNEPSLVFVFLSRISVIFVQITNPTSGTSESKLAFLFEVG